MGAALYGYTKLYGQVPGGQAEFLRVPHADYNPIKVPEGPPDDRFVYLSDVLPTAWQGVEYADIPDGGSVTILGQGPIGQMAARIAAHRGHRVIAVDLVPERLERARAWGAETVDLSDHGKDLADVIRSDDRRARHRRRDRRGGDGGARLPRRPARAADGRPAAQAGGRQDHGEGRRRQPQRVLLGDRHRAPRGDDLAQRRLRRPDRPAADADPVRQADPAPHGPGQRAPLARADPPAAGRRRSARRRRVRLAPAPARGRADGLREVPEEGGRLLQGAA